jgi:hypothetical protein
MTVTPGNAEPDPQEIIAELQRMLDKARASAELRDI